MGEKVTAIVLSGGKGKRMGASVSKQYLLLKDKPILYYSLKAFDESDVDEIVLVVGKEDFEFVKEEIVNKYQIKKVTSIVEGGAERYNSVYNGLCEIERSTSKTDYVLVHDGARPFIEVETINKVIDVVKDVKACVVGMPVKDTIKISDADGNVSKTPDRKMVWQIQTPQAFEYSILKNGYDCIINSGCKNITDDSMVVESTSKVKIKLLEGGYSNIKITTPEDLEIGMCFLKEK